MEQESVVDGNLATEASLIVLDTLEIIVKVRMILLQYLATFLLKSHGGVFDLSPLSDGGCIRV